MNMNNKKFQNKNLKKMNNRINFNKIKIIKFMNNKIDFNKIKMIKYQKCCKMMKIKEIISFMIK